MSTFELRRSSDWGFEDEAHIIQVFPLALRKSGWGGSDLALFLLPTPASGSYRPRIDARYALSTSDFIVAIKSKFGLTMKSLSELIGVSRQTLYDWISQSHTPTQEHQLKLDRLLNLGQYWNSISSKPIGGSTKKESNVEGVSISRLLTDSDIELERAKEVLRDLANRKEARARRIKSLQSSSVTEGLQA